MTTRQSGSLPTGPTRSPASDTTQWEQCHESTAIAKDGAPLALTHSPYAVVSAVSEVLSELEMLLAGPNPPTSAPASHRRPSRASHMIAPCRCDGAHSAVGRAARSTRGGAPPTAPTRTTEIGSLRCADAEVPPHELLRPANGELFHQSHRRHVHWPHRRCGMGDGE